MHVSFLSVRWSAASLLFVFALLAHAENESLELPNAPAHAATVTKPWIAEGRVSKEALLRALTDEYFLPRLQAMATASRKLAESGKSYCAKPSEAKLRDLQAQWFATQQAWQELEPLPIGPVIKRNSYPEMDLWPTRPVLLMSLLSGNDPLTPEEREALPGRAKGLPAIERLIFNRHKTPTAMTKQLRGRSCAVMAWLAEGVAEESKGLLTDWQNGYAVQLREAGKRPQERVFGLADHAVEDLVNYLIVGLDYIQSTKLEKPLQEYKWGSTKEELVEAPYSGASVALLAANLDGFVAIFFGSDGPGGKQIGFDDYLEGLNKPELVRATRENVEEARQILKGFGKQPLQLLMQRRQADIERLRTLLWTIRERLERDVATAMNVTLSFEAKDGDW